MPWRIRLRDSDGPTRSNLHGLASQHLLRFIVMLINVGAGGSERKSLDVIAFQIALARALVVAGQCD